MAIDAALSILPRCPGSPKSVTSVAAFSLYDDIAGAAALSRVVIDVTASFESVADKYPRLDALFNTPFPIFLVKTK